MRHRALAILGSLATLAAIPLVFAMAETPSYCQDIPVPVLEDLKQMYIASSSVILRGWELQNIDANCGGTLKVVYSLPDYSDSKALFLVEILEIRSDNIREGKPFTEEFIQEHDKVILDKVQGIRDRDVFKDAYQEWSNITVLFTYPPESHITIEGYGQVSTCTSRIDIEEYGGKDIVHYVVSNDVDMNMSLPTINLGREYIQNYLSNYYNLTGSSNGLKPVTETSCGRTNGYDSDSGSPAFTTGHAVYLDIECEGCPVAVQVNMYHEDMIPMIYTDLAPDGSPVKSTYVQGSYLAVMGEFNGSISSSSPTIRNVGGKIVESTNIGEPLVPSVLAHNGASGMLSCVIVLELRDENGITVALKLQERDIPQGNILDAGLIWRPEHTGTYQVRGFMITDLKNPQILTDVKATNITVFQ